MAKMIRMQSGAEQLRDWMERRFPNSERKARDAAEYLGWHESFISKVLAGSRKLGLTNALHLERRTGIPTEAWEASQLDETDERDPAQAAKPR